MVATQVLEEGLNIPRCNLVIRTNNPNNFSSYVQSRGRLRADRALFSIVADVKDEFEIKYNITLYKGCEQVCVFQSF